MTTERLPARERILDAAQDLVLAHGFSATTVDAVLAAARASKGAFFHHFPTKGALGQALVERYAEADEEVLESFMQAAESRSSDPAEQLIDFLRSFEAASEEIALRQPGCLFVSFIYEQVGDAEGIDETIRESIGLWRRRILDKLDAVAASRPMAALVDLESLADHVFTTFEGAFILARATDDPDRLRAQISHLRHYLELLMAVPAA